jgi:hypothetical protein
MISMSNRWHLPLMSAAFAALTIFSGVMAFLSEPKQVTAQQAEQNFPDVPANYWARPFIQPLAQRGIIAGYPDGRFRPEQPIGRDEFAAIIRQSFDKERVRNISSGSDFNDVSENYWATQPIEEAYEMGFMGAFDGNTFRPRQGITRAQALAALSRGMNLSYDRPTTTTTQRRTQPRTARNGLVFPLATTALMQPLFSVIAPQQPKPTTPAPRETAAQIPAPRYLNLYYNDADQIPQALVNPVAAATQANVVVNYPESQLLRPNEMLKRSTAAAMIHRALVAQGRLEALPNNTQARKYFPQRIRNTSNSAKAN